MILAPILCLLLAGPAPGADQGLQPLDGIRSAVEGFLAESQGPTGEDRSIEVGHVDPRLRLALCERPLDLSLPSTTPRGGNLTVNVRCPGDRPWNLYVPARVRTFARVVVLARPARPGSALTLEDLRVERRDVSALTSGYLTDPAAAVGRPLARAAGAGQALSPELLSRAVLVRRGTRVPLVARVGGVDVRMQGEALREGAVGDTISVRNLSSQRVIEGRIAEDGSVHVGM
jgi:flagella basal body P-ring formation protein FlgA